MGNTHQIIITGVELFWMISCVLHISMDIIGLVSENREIENPKMLGKNLSRAWYPNIQHD